jgi:hypothetical protein
MLWLFSWDERITLPMKMVNFTQIRRLKSIPSPFIAHASRAPDCVLVMTEAEWVCAQAG